MTDTGPPTNPGDIVSIGQRGQRRDDRAEPFPERPQIVVWEGMFDELPPDVEIPFDPCSNPETAHDWNVDAAAAKAAKEFARRAALAGEDGFQYRERGAWIVQLPDGTFDIGPIITGDPFNEDGDGWVTPNYEGVDPTTVVAFVHTHRQAGHRPSGSSPRPGLSGGDVGAFYDLRNQMISQGRDPNLAREYIVAYNELGAGQTPYPQINAYDHTNIEASQTEFKTGPEVNPEAQPCS